MQVEISDLKSIVRAVDDDSLLSPPTLDRIVRIVLQAVDERDAHRGRVRDEQKISTGINHDFEETEWSSWNK